MPIWGKSEDPAGLLAPEHNNGIKFKPRTFVPSLVLVGRLDFDKPSLEVSECLNATIETAIPMVNQLGRLINLDAIYRVGSQ